jgi:hypothetical protein
MKRLLAIGLLLLSWVASAGDLPSGYIGRVLNNTANTWQNFSFSYTPTTTGSQYVMLAFRQDPAYWYVDNVKVTASGSTTNMLTNGDMTTGGSMTAQTSNYGTIYINAPTAWGVSYQSGVYPSAAGTWMNGQWVDGAVGSYDGIYQGMDMTAGVTYTISFDVMGNHTATTTTTSWQLAVYAGACADVSLNASECSMPSSSGYTSVVSPSQTYTTGCGNNCPTNPATPSYSSSITTAQQARVSAFTNSSGNRVIIQQIGNYNTTTVIQSGAKNYVDYAASGNYNEFSITQSSTNTGTVKYNETIVTGSNNVVGITQQGTGSQNMFTSIAGSGNTVSAQQKDGGNHYLDLTLTGAGHNVTVLQQGTGAHASTINVTNAGGAATVNVSQSGSTAQVYSLTQSCATTTGCSTTITQGQ